ncbi:MAG: hypothetical protein PHX01_07305 [Clostridia bacterium]|nr:hypothetical protein [Clostridia bacterium]
MGLLLEIIREESQRNLLMQEQYEAKINQLPKGRIILKKVGNHEYCYLKYRDGEKTITDYIGRDETKISEVKNQLNKRKHFEKMLAELKKENRLIQKVIGGSV